MQEKLKARDSPEIYLDEEQILIHEEQKANNYMITDYLMRNI